MNTCEMCGLPEWAVTGEGLPVKITVKAENRFKRDSTKTVWCCSEECAIQTLGIAKHGINTYKWPVTLAQFRAMERANVTKSRPQITDSRDSSGCLNPETVSECGSGIFVTKRGRPKKANPMTGAERVRAHRAHKEA